jgi:hypothetical protein
MRTTYRSNCHTLTLSLGTRGNVVIAFMPAAARPLCILYARDLGMPLYLCVCLLLQYLL